MSLLINESYVNPNTPLWVSATGDTIDGDLTVNGNLAVTGNATFTGTSVRIQSADKLYFTNAIGSSTGLLEYSDPTGVNGSIETFGTLYFGRLLTGNTANTSFTPSAAGTNGDVLAVGGRITTAPGGGISPVSSPTALVNVTLGATVPMVPTTPIAIATGKWYDIQVTGYWTIPLLSVPAVGDKAEIFVAVGSGVAPTYFNVSAQDVQYPGLADDPWVAGSYRPFKIRARLLAGSNLASPVINATLTGTGVYPAGVDAEITALSVVALS